MKNTYDINELIDINLKVICESRNKKIFTHEFLDSNGDTINNKLNSEIFATEMESRNLISTINELCIVTDFGIKVYENGGWIKYKIEQDEIRKHELIKQKEKDELDLKKLKVDLELAEKTLKEFPRTKWFARIGFFIAIVLALKELYILIMQSPS